MNFTEPHVNFLQSDIGWAVEIIPRRSGIIKYYDGDKFIKVDSEMLSSPYDLVIYADSIKFWDTLEGSIMPITIQEKKEIVKNILCALDYKGIKAQLYWPESNL